MSLDPAGKSQRSVGSNLPDLQFDHAEAAQPAVNSCLACGTPIVDRYYSLNGHTLCPSCAEAQRRVMPDQPRKGDFARAALFGVGAALVGTALYFVILAVSGYEIGLVAIAVGWLVGKAVQKGSRGIGGRKLQLLAVTLTYFSIVGSNVPMTLKYALERPSEQAQPPSDGQRRSPAAITEDSPISASGLLITIVVIFVYSLASPFLHGFSGIIGVFIIGIGLYEAWKLNQRIPLALEGPFPAPPSGARA